MARPKKTKEEPVEKSETTNETTTPKISQETTKFLKECAVGAAEAILSNVSRDSNGFLKGIEYKFKEDGSVDYKSMIPNEFIGLNKENFKRKGIDIYSLGKAEFEALKEKAEDKEKTILLAGIRWLAMVRGYTKIKSVSKPIENRAVCDTQITWIPNQESMFREVVTSGTGTYFYDSNDKMRFFMDSLAENRSFCRNVRNALNITIVSNDELTAGAAPEPEDNSNVCVGPPEPLKMLEKAMSDIKWTFDQLVAKIIANPKEGDVIEEIQTWKTIKDIPKPRCLAYVERIKKALETKTSGK